jgi:hypothetical protein
VTTEIISRWETDKLREPRKTYHRKQRNRSSATRQRKSGWLHHEAGQRPTGARALRIPRCVETGVEEVRGNGKSSRGWLRVQRGHGGTVHEEAGAARGEDRWS